MAEPVEILRTNNACTGTLTYLHRSNWVKHVEKRPELLAHLQSVKVVVEGPDFALQNEQGMVFKYRHGLGTGNLARLWLLVIEEPDGKGSHYVKTMYFTPEIKDEHILCLNRIPTGEL